MKTHVRTIDTKIGPLLLAAAPDGLLRIAFASEDFDRVTDELAAQHGPASPEADPAALAVLDRSEAELASYLSGDSTSLNIAVGAGPTSDFRRAVLAAVAKIPYGQTATYGEIAAAVGAPGSARAVGSACATNPLPIVVPCHRVVRSDGTPGQYLGGIETKAALLELERR